MPSRRLFRGDESEATGEANCCAGIEDNLISAAGVQTGAYLLNAWQEEGFHAGKACLRSHAGHIPEEGRARLPVPVVEVGDHGWQQEVVAQPAWQQWQVQFLM